MKKLNILFSAALLMVLTQCSTADKHEKTPEHKADTATAVAHEAPEPEPTIDSATAAKNWEAYMTPGDMHKWMASQEGKWNAELSFWNAPGQSSGPPSTASVENKMVMGGRYQEAIYKGTMMGMPFEGHGIMGYDNAKKKFINTWIDNSGTGVMYMEGPYDEATKTINMTGKMIDPSTGKDCEMRQEIKTIDDKHYVLAMYNMKEGKEFKSMEIKFAKK